MENLSSSPASVVSQRIPQHRINSKTILFIGFTAILVLMLLLTILGPYGMHSIHTRLRSIVEVNIEKIDIAIHMRSAARERSLSLHKMILSDDPFERDDAWMRFNTYGAVFAKERLQLLSMQLTAKEVELLEEQAEITKQIIPAQLKIVELVNQEKFKEAELMLVKEAIPLQDSVLILLEELYHFQEDAAEEAAEKSDEAYERIRNFMYALSAVILILSCLIDLMMYRKIRNAELRDEQYAGELEKSRDKAQAANTAKTKFLATMSHELRTPLNAVIGYSDLLLDDINETSERDNSEHKEFVTKIRYSGLHLLHIIEEILHISRIESGKTQIIKNDVSIKEVVELSVVAVLPIAKYNNNQIEQDLSKSPQIIFTDGVRLQHILTNLLSNACKFTDNGKITLSVYMVEREEKNWVVFKVADTGIGIPEEYHQMIFERFTQADNSFTRRYEGVGLGLSVCNKYCELLGGEIALKSEPGNGSEFTVFLPVQDDNQLQIIM